MSTTPRSSLGSVSNKISAQKDQKLPKDMGSSSSKQARTNPSAISIDNATGATMAASQLSSVLGDTLEQFELEGKMSSRFKQLLIRLDREAASYSNSKVNDDEATRWDCSQDQAQFIATAWKCATGAYHLEEPLQDTSYCTFTDDHVLYHSLDGSIKALKATRVETGQDNGFLPVLVIAIRGSATKMDHVVNANARTRPLGEYMKSDWPGMGVHAGFLNSAWALDDIVSKRIDNYIQTYQSRHNDKPHVLFTGHSAGGAVASLIYLRYTSDSAYGDNARFSCLTFGAPPIITGDVDLSRYKPPGLTLMANMMNEFDPVTRIDRAYIISLVDLAKHIAAKSIDLHGKTDQQATDIALDYLGEPLSSQSTFSSGYDSEITLLKRTAQGTVWEMSRPLYRHIGPRKILMTRLVGTEVGLEVVDVSTAEFERLIFCRIAVHRRSCYGQRIELLERGHFNHQKGWTSNSQDKDLS